MGEIWKNPETDKRTPDNSFDTQKSPESERTMWDLFKDDFDSHEQCTEKLSNEISDKIDADHEMEGLFADDYMENGKDTTDNGEQQEDFDLTKQYEPNCTYDVNGKTYETDDNGYVYKVDGYELRPDCEYTIDGVTYKTDSLGRIISCDGKAKSTPEGERDNRAQAMAGGEDRKPGDQGGHILARIFGGAKGIENMLAMRGTAINQSVYKRMENRIAEAIAPPPDGKNVDVHVDVEYEGDSQRPSKITVNYTIDGKETVVQYDNDEGSIDLVDSLEGKIEDEDLNDLKQEIQDANEDGANMSVVSVKTEYDENGNIEKVTVTIRDENSDHPVNEDRVFTPKEET
ncbi:MAG: DNA/RNA non-specific endonuclease [Aeriscardovia sp.]|nr:DNA/RNA non-specific endonuclease [Aeriscardovia sp.]